MADRSVNCFENRSIRCRIVEGEDTVWAIINIREDFFQESNSIIVREVLLTDGETGYSRWMASVPFGYKCPVNVDVFTKQASIEGCIDEVLTNSFLSKPLVEVRAWIALSPEK